MKCICGRKLNLKDVDTDISYSSSPGIFYIMKFACRCRVKGEISVPHNAYNKYLKPKSSKRKTHS